MTKKTRAIEKQKHKVRVIKKKMDYLLEEYVIEVVEYLELLKEKR